MSPEFAGNAGLLLLCIAGGFLVVLVARALKLIDASRNGMNKAQKILTLAALLAFITAGIWPHQKEVYHGEHHHKIAVYDYGELVIWWIMIVAAYVGLMFLLKGQSPQ